MSNKMSCLVNQNLVGCKVVVETTSVKFQGNVRAVDPTGGKVSIINGVLEPSNDPLPPLYRVFVKDIISISIVEQNEREASGSRPAPELKLFSDIEPQLRLPLNRNQSKPLVQKKTLPSHIRRLNNHIESDILTNKVPLIQNGNVMKPVITNYVVIDSINDIFHDAISTLSIESDIGISMEGVRIGRFGTICWIGMAGRNKTFLFDMCSLGPVGFQEGLSNIITNPNILKVTHDCRYMADALLHRYGVKIENVFDTQVAAVVVEKQKTRDFVFNRFVPGLVRCLSEYLKDLPQEKMFMPRTRIGYEKEDEKRWIQRPLPDHLLEGAVFNVCHLKRLRLALMEALMREVTMGTTLYLKEVSEISDDCVAEKYLIAHQLPLSFKELPQPRTQKNSTVYRDHVPFNFCDPYVGFSRHVSHVRKS